MSDLLVSKVGLLANATMCLYNRCNRKNCMETTVHEHCLGVKTNKKPCNNRPGCEQYCHLHVSQSKCFYPECKEDVCGRHNYCIEHLNYYYLYRILTDVFDDATKKDYEINNIMDIISFYG